MKRLALLGILVCVLTQAAHAGFYARAGLLYNSPSDVKVNEGSNAYKSSIDNAMGYTVGVGYMFSKLRLEAELNSMNSDLRNTDFVEAITSGDYKRTSYFANLLFEIPFTPIVEPYIGAGIGVSRVKVDFEQLASEGSLQDSFSSSASDDQFSYQLIAGVRLSFFETVSVYVSYRYLNTDGLSFSEGSYQLKSGTTTHLFEVGFGIGF